MQYEEAARRLHTFDIDKKVAIDRLQLALKHSKDDHRDDLDLLAHLWPTPDDVGGHKVWLHIRFAFFV